MYLHPIFPPSYVENYNFLQFFPRMQLKIPRVLRIISLDLDIHHFRRDSRNERMNERTKRVSFMREILALRALRGGRRGKGRWKLFVIPWLPVSIR